MKDLDQCLADLGEWERLTNIALDAADKVVERASRLNACSERMRAQCLKNLMHTIQTELKPALKALEVES